MNSNDHFIGMKHVWWMGIVEDRNDPLKIGRCRVRMFGWNTDNKAMLPTEKLIWCHPLIPLGSKTIVPPAEGVMVKGYFMDGEGAQHPIMEGIVPGIPDTAPDTSKGFSDPRTDNDLQSAPRPPKSVDYPTTGAGVTVTEAAQAQRYPVVLNEPNTSRIARNENIQDTIIARKNATLVTAVPVATGGIPLQAGIDVHAVLNARALLAAVLPRNVTNLLNKFGNIEICGVSINSLLNSAVLVGDINIQTPTFIGGEIFLGGLALLDALANGITLSGFADLSVDINGCIIGPGPIGGFIHLDSGIKIPTLPSSLSIVESIPGLTIGATVSGGVPLGNMGGIPMTTSASWNEPRSPYNARYPYNHVHESESGHVIEIDDTPGHERLHRFHRSGTFEEIGPDGSRVTKIVKNNYHITMSDDNVHVMGDCNVTVSGNRNEQTTTDKKVNVDGKHVEMIKSDSTETILGAQTNVVAKTRTTTITENDDLLIQGASSHAVGKDYNVIVMGDRNVIVKGKSTVAVVGDCQLLVQGNCITNVAGDMTATIMGSATSTVTGDQNFTAANFNFTSVGAFTINAASILYETPDQLTAFNISGGGYTFASLKPIIFSASDIVLSATNTFVVNNATHVSIPANH